MVNDHFVLWPWRPHKLQFNPPLILSFTAGSIIKLAWIQFRHLPLGAVLVPWSSLFSEFLHLVSHSLTASCFQKPCLLSWFRQLQHISIYQGKNHIVLSSTLHWNMERASAIIPISQLEICVCWKWNELPKMPWQVNIKTQNSWFGIYSWPLNNTEVRAPTPTSPPTHTHTLENPHMTLLTVSPLYLCFCICGFNQPQIEYYISETSWTLWDLPTRKGFPWSSFLVCRKRLSAYSTFPGPQRADLNSY